MRESGNEVSMGTLTSLPEGSTIEHIYSFVSDSLAQWAKAKDHSKRNENSMTNELTIALNGNMPPECPYRFQHQPSEDEKSGTSTDFAAFHYSEYSAITAESLGQKALVKFEAKRLTKGLGNDRTREYVIGHYKEGKIESNTGAVERFKNGTHGKDMSHAAILAYVQRDDFNTWKTRVNSWIDDEITSSSDKNLSWINDDKLVWVSTATGVSIYRSISSRCKNSDISIRHLWVDLCPKSKIVS